ncbi:MAG TPA: HrpE/YscL family type III secretion apparatus protein [Chlamydiales bacterium]|nr:HrpE/YscL family type III secretion apparatus protein [Chlamydiales bacterium]
MSNTKDKKFFTLIYGTEVKPAGEKIIDQEAFSDLVTSKELLEKIHQESEQYRQEVIAECEVYKEQARKEGFEVGYNAWVEQLKNLESEIEKVRDEMMKLMMPIALKAAKKIVASELTSSEDAIVNIVRSTAKAVAQHKKIIIYVNKADFNALEKSKSKVKELFEQLESLSIRERDDVEQGGCVIETEAGIINAQIQDRWRTLETAFEALNAQMRKEEAQKAKQTDSKQLESPQMESQIVEPPKTEPKKPLPKAPKAKGATS